MSERRQRLPERRRVLLKRLERQVKLDGNYLLLMGAAGVLAAVALLTNSVPVLIGSMIVAPALPPLALAAFALTATDGRLVGRGLLVALLGLLLAMLCAMAVTWVLNITNVIPPGTNLMEKPLLAERVRPGWYSVFSAVAAGIAGAMALTQQKTDTLVGVLAALALVPSVGAVGIALISKSPASALGGVALLGINVGVIVVTHALTLLLTRRH